jgi:hypothetical protein
VFLEGRKLQGLVSDDVENRAMARFSSHVRDRFIAPGVSAFNTAEVPDMSTYDPESKHWVANHFLNSVLRGKLNPPANAYAYSYVRRAEAAFSEHDQARQATLDFIISGAQSPSLYAAAVLHWEFFLSQSWQGYALLARLLALLGAGERFKIFVRGDGSVEERLNLLHNSMKHAESRIAAGQILEGAPVPVWLTNEGIQSTDTLLKYPETGDILRDIARWANILVDPIEMANRLRGSG